jgi:hypothetical protein
MVKKMSPQEWMNKYVQGRTWGWEELIGSGRAPLGDLKDSDLKIAINKWLEGIREVQGILDSLGYEVG